MHGQSEAARFTDTHAHLDFPHFDEDREEVIARALKAGVCRIINVGADIASSKAAIALAESHPFIHAAVGIHPHDAHTLTDESLQELAELAKHPKVVAIGEIGLDFYRRYCPHDVQRRAFRRQLDLARELGKPVVIHARAAHEEVLSILEEKGPLPGVMHCFSGSLEIARRALKLGLFVSVAGPVTFKNARKLPLIVREVPLEKLLIETDCPYLAPHPFRGKRNEPSHLPLIAEAVARIKGTTTEEVARITTLNASNLFGLPVG